jgi:kynureninase
MHFPFNGDESFAKRLDADDPLHAFRSQFHMPRTPEGKDQIYLCGNSLGLQPIAVRAFIEEELRDWAELGVEGHFRAKHPWMPYHELLTVQSASVVGALPIEVVVMNTLTVNLHLLMVSFYRPVSERYKIIIEEKAFPSDQYAAASQLRVHGFDPADGLVEIPLDADGRFSTASALDTI